MRNSNTMSLARLAVFTMAAFTTATAAFNTAYCSTQNTGTTDQFFWTWQSNGKCSDHCREQGTYAFAVIKYTDCWCSNIAPGSSVDNEECQIDCPGFPDEKCGDKDKGLFIYIELDGTASSTQGASQPTSKATVSSAAPVPSSTEEPTSTEATTNDPPPTTMRTTSAAPPATSATKTEEPVTTPMVFTESGVVVTRTVVVTPTPTPVSATTGTTEKKSNTGAIVGGAVGGVLGLLAIVGGILFVLWRRRRQQQRVQNGEVDSSGITRNTSTMSRHGLLGGLGEKTDPRYPPPIVTKMGSQRSRQDTESGSPMSGSERRFSQPVLVDSRLNPRAVLTFHGSNESRDSIGSIDDSRDYGRQLNVVNPDK